MTPEDKTYGELRDQLFVDIAERQAAAQVSIARLESEINTHRQVAAQRGEWQDHSAAQAELAQVAPKQREIDALRIQLRELDGERGLATDGRHAQLQGAERHAAGTAHRGSQQAEYREATAAFEAFITPELRAAAVRVIEANKSMHGDSNRYPPIAVAIAQTI